MKNLEVLWNSDRKYRKQIKKMLKQTQINKILKKYKDVFEALENYDKTRELPFQRKRIDVTLSVETINKLKKIKEKTGKPISRIIEEKIKGCSSKSKT